MRIEESGGLKCKNQKTCNVNAESQPPLFSHMATISGDGTVEGGLGEVLHSARKLGGQALAADWSKNGRISSIKEPRVSYFWSMKLATILEVFGRLGKGLLIFASRRRILEHLVRFGACFEAIRSFAGKRRRVTG